MTIDAHTHSRRSDGTQAPAELIADAAASGIAVLGLTDHDTVSGWDESARAAREHGVGLLRGMEVSCHWEGISVHLLSYLHDPRGAELTATADAAREARLRRTRTMAERLAEDFPITWEGVRAQAGDGATIGRPHLADALVAAGVVPDRSAAFAQILSGASKYYVSLPTISPVDAIRMVREAGGVSVFAHPMAASRGRVVPREGFAQMIAAGLDGLEVDHRDNPPEARERLRAIAADNGLLTTGSSDYHGAGKPNRLGEHSTAPEQLAALVERASGSDFLPG
ncbi:PHP domain-containing protein [Brevibacterium sp. BRM-1]|uniref:PHP domain-containing protein n=1 Tax=Brevibacterium sp. BRM-1 TaxID=2999062 RepID=UPI0022810406|nr:PHP domain-containing protein [Brevibacterium sp. BRM-1]WAL40491.1 PHP domain-containing protein [Brevibacterium sp. BRM-1]